MFRYTKILSGIFTTAYFAVIRWRWPKGELDMEGYFHIFFPQPTSDGWLMGFYGLVIGVFVIPGFLTWIERDKEYERFLDKLGQEPLAKAKIKLFKNLSRAYHRWKKTHKNFPDSMGDLIHDSAFPQCVPMVKGEISTKIDEEFCGSPSGLWLFLHDLYIELDAYIRTRKKPKLLLENEMDELHEARQTLSYYWDYVAVLILKRHLLRYRNIKPHLEIERALIKVLVIMEIENHRAIRGSRAGEQWLFYLGAVLFEKRKWGFGAWFWNPCLTAVENLRT